MTRALHALGTAALALWWSPTFGAALVHAAPHLAAALGTAQRGAWPGCAA